MLSYSLGCRTRTLYHKRNDGTIIVWEKKISLYIKDEERVEIFSTTPPPRATHSLELLAIEQQFAQQSILFKKERLIRHFE